MIEASKNSLLLRGLRIVAPHYMIERGTVLIEGSSITRIIETDTSALPAVDTSLDLDGLTLFPGFIDVHIHGAVGVDTMNASADDLRRVATFLASNGVTAWLPTLVPSDVAHYKSAVNSIQQVMERASVDETESRLEYRLQSGLADSEKGATEAGSINACQARVLGVHYEGPFVNDEQCGALHREHFRTFTSASNLDELPTIPRKGAIHLMTLAPETDGGIDLIKELKRRTWIASIGHTRATVDVLDRALEAGARHMTHFMNAMAPLHHRTPGPVGWGLLCDNVTCDLIADGVHVDPLMLKLILRSKGAERISLISDAIAAAGLGDGEYQIWDEKISVKNGRTQNARGSIAGSVITMLDAVRTMLSVGASEVEVARMASTNPARLLQIDHDCGSIEEGKRADLVALDQDGKVRLTIVGGRRS